MADRTEVSLRDWRFLFSASHWLSLGVSMADIGSVSNGYELLWI